MNEIDEISFSYSGTWEKEINIKMYRKENGEFSYYIESDKKKGIFDLDKMNLSILVGILINEFQIDRWDDCYTQKSHLNGFFCEDGRQRRYIPVCDGWCGCLYIKRIDYEKEIHFGSAGPEVPVDFMEIKKLFTDIFIMEAYNCKKYTVEIL